MNGPALSNELRIVWLEDIDRLDYVRETVTYTTRPRQRPRPPTGRLVGYAEVQPDGSGTYARRVFWLKPYDRDSAPTGNYQTGAPTEAVDPRTVAVGVPGQLTERAWGRPLVKAAP